MAEGAMKRRRWATAAVCNGLAAALVASWLWPGTRPAWDALDLRVFLALNGSLDWGRPWQVFWAVMNWRPSDLLAGCMILGLVWVWLRRCGRASAKRGLASLGAFAVLLVATRVFSSEVVCDGYQRPSPTKAVRADGAPLIPGAIRLGDLVSRIDPKDSAKDCFPADHAYVLIAMTVFLWIHAGRRFGVVSAALLAPFALPRLVGGAHWATDILVGAVCMALVSLSLWFGTPLSAWVVDKAERKGDRLLTWCVGLLRLSKA